MILSPSEVGPEKEESNLQIATPDSSWLSPKWLTWNKYSETMLRQLEKRILQIVRTPHRGFYVDIGPVVGPADKIWTISCNTESHRTPLLLLHGLGGGVALWCLNLDALSENRPVYAIDLPGFGRSSRPTFSTDANEAEKQVVKAIEEWRKEMKLKKFIILGHSTGGFLAASYAITHPDRVQHLMLADPWGFPERPQVLKKNLPLWVRTVAYMMQPFNPLTAIRVAGPFGPWMINALRPDISKKYATALNDTTMIPQYIYQCNSQSPTGESAFHCMMQGFGWAKNPMVNRIHQLRTDVPITLVYGSRSWIENDAVDIIKEKRYNGYFKAQAINGAGHHVYADKPDVFSQMIVEACEHGENGGVGNKLPIMSAEDVAKSQEIDQ